MGALMIHDCIWSGVLFGYGMYFGNVSDSFGFGHRDDTL